jgi:U3 small nucleolar RNA-associated protein 21
MQSGEKRGQFDVGPTPPEATRSHSSSSKKNNAERCVTGLASDALNRVVIASTLDGTLNVRIARSSVVNKLVHPFI